MKKFFLVLSLIALVSFVSCDKEDTTLPVPDVPEATDMSDDAYRELFGSFTIDLPEDWTGKYYKPQNPLYPRYHLTALRGIYPQNTNAPRAIITLPEGTDGITYEVTYGFAALGTGTTVENGVTIYTDPFRKIVQDIYGFEIAGRNTAYKLSFGSTIPASWRHGAVFNVGSVSADLILVIDENTILPAVE